MKYQIYTVISLAGGAIATVFGGWDQAYKKYFEDGALFDKIYTNQ